MCRAYDFDPNREAQAFQQAAPVAKKEEDAPKPPQRVSCFLLSTLIISRQDIHPNLWKLNDLQKLYFMRW